MTRHQSTRRILDAVELRGGVLTKVDRIKVGDTVMFSMPSADYVVEEVETDSIGQIRHRADDNMRTCSYMPGEFLYIKAC